MTPSNRSIVWHSSLQYRTVMTKVFHPLCSDDFTVIIHIIFLTRKSRGGRSVTDWQAATPAYQPIACGLLCDVRKTLWINSFSFEDQSCAADLQNSENVYCPLLGND